MFSRTLRKSHPCRTWLNFDTVNAAFRCHNEWTKGSGKMVGLTHTRRESFVVNLLRVIKLPHCTNVDYIAKNGCQSVHGDNSNGTL